MTGLLSPGISGPIFGIRARAWLEAAPDEQRTQILPGIVSFFLGMWISISSRLGAGASDKSGMHDAKYSSVSVEMMRCKDRALVSLRLLPALAAALAWFQLKDGFSGLDAALSPQPAIRPGGTRIVNKN